MNQEQIQLFEKYTMGFFGDSNIRVDWETESPYFSLKLESNGSHVSLYDPESGNFNLEPWVDCIDLEIKGLYNPFAVDLSGEAIKLKMQETMEKEIGEVSAELKVVLDYLMSKFEKSKNDLFYGNEYDDTVKIFKQLFGVEEREYWANLIKDQLKDSLKSDIEYSVRIMIESKFREKMKDSLDENYDVVLNKFLDSLNDVFYPAFFNKIYKYIENMKELSY